MLALLVAFSVISATAQSTKQYDVKIPFNFNLGHKNFDAGDYVVRITKSAVNSLILSLEDENGKRLQSVVVAEKGDTGRGEYRLVFNRYDNRRFLSKIMTGNESFSIPKSGDEKQLAAGKRRDESKTEVAGLMRGR
jgi:hypothetical protein